MSNSKRAALELSMNFLVMLIIAITIFGFGVRFVYQISSSATELKDLTSDELDERVDDLLCSSSSKVCIGKDTYTVRRGELQIYGVKILNIEDAQEFIIRISQPSSPVSDPVVGFRKDDSSIALSSLNGVNLYFAPEERRVTLPRNKDQLVGIGVDVPKNMPPGTYILNVQVFKERRSAPQDATCGVPPTLAHSCYVSMQKLYVNVP